MSGLIGCDRALCLARILTVCDEWRSLVRILNPLAPGSSPGWPTKDSKPACCSRSRSKPSRHGLAPDRCTRPFGPAYCAVQSCSSVDLRPLRHARLHYAPSPGWPTRTSISLPIRRTLAARCLRCLLTYTSTLRGLLATDPPSHSASKPICRFWSWWLAPSDPPHAGGSLSAVPAHANECATRAPRH